MILQFISRIKLHVYFSFSWDPVPTYCPLHFFSVHTYRTVYATFHRTNRWGSPIKRTPCPCHLPALQISEYYTFLSLPGSKQLLRYIPYLMLNHSFPSLEHFVAIMFRYYFLLHSASCPWLSPNTNSWTLFV